MLIQVINRQSGKLETEQVYGKNAVLFAYGEAWYQKFLLTLVSRLPLFSFLYGTWQKCPWTKNKVKKFIQTYHIDASEFEKNDFTSFNDFFIRRLKPSVRPLAKGAVIPADGRYLAFQNFEKSESLFIKGQKFSLETLFEDPALANRYQKGSLLFGRLCPTDYHRFHFPCSGVPAKSRLINGSWYSVNPFALKKNIHILTQNKRMVTKVHTKNYGTVLIVEIGATNVGSIIQTYHPDLPVQKGQEKGYFSFGASALVVLFEPGAVQFCEDLLEASRRGCEVRCLMGQPLTAP